MTIKSKQQQLACLLAAATTVVLSAPGEAVSAKRSRPSAARSAQPAAAGGAVVWPTKESDRAREADQAKDGSEPQAQSKTAIPAQSELKEDPSQPWLPKAPKLTKAFGPPVNLTNRIKSAIVKSGYRFVPDVPYVPEGRPCTGDFYLPAQASDKPQPAIIVVHGGAWVIGSKTDSGESDIAQRLARHGYVVFSIDYRLISDGALYPASIRDTKDALGFVVENAAKLNIDTSRIGMYGGSAGGMMAMLAAYSPNSGTLQADHYKTLSTKPKCVVAYCPVTDIRNFEKTWIFRYLDDTPYHSPEKFVEASPITYVKTAVPTLCIHGDDDPMVPAEQSEELVKALKAAGIQAEYVIVPNVRHAFHEQPGPGRELAFARLQSFFDSQLKPAAQAGLSAAAGGGTPNPAAAGTP